MCFFIHFNIIDNVLIIFNLIFCVGNFFYLEITLSSSSSSSTVPFFFPTHSPSPFMFFFYDDPIGSTRVTYRNIGGYLQENGYLTSAYFTGENVSLLLTTIDCFEVLS